jgi:hypothetical protein
MTVDRFVVLILVFVAGFATASIVPNRNGRSPEPLDYSQPIKLVLTSNPSDPQCVEYVSHRVVVDGQGHDVRTFQPSENAEVWRVEMSGGRVVLFGTCRPFE